MKPNNYFIWSHLRHLQKYFKEILSCWSPPQSDCVDHIGKLIFAARVRRLFSSSWKKVLNSRTIWSPIKNHPQSREAQILCWLWTSWGFSSCWCFRPGASWAGWGKRDDDKGIKRKDFKSLKSTNLCGLLTPGSKFEVTFLLIKWVISHIDFTFAYVPDGAYHALYTLLTWLDVKALNMPPSVLF